MRTLEMYVRRSDGTAYVEAAGRDDAATRREIDRAAWMALSRPDVVRIEVESNERTGGYKR
jgi:hypothetical protein